MLQPPNFPMALKRLRYHGVGLSVFVASVSLLNIIVVVIGFRWVVAFPTIGIIFFVIFWSLKRMFYSIRN